MSEQRLTEVFREFCEEAIDLGKEVAGKVAAALRESITGHAAGEGRKVGAEFKAWREVELATFKSALPAELRAAGGELVRRVGKECAARGDEWAREGLHVAIVEHLCIPLEAAAGDHAIEPKAAPAPVKAKGGKK